MAKKFKKKTERKGTITARTTVKDHGTKELVHMEEEVENYPVPEGDGPLCYTSGSIGVNRSRNYQSVTFHVGGEMPWRCKPGDTKRFLECMKAFEALLEKKMADRIDEMDKLLQELG